MKRAVLWLLLLFTLAIISPAEEHAASQAEEHKEAAEPDMTVWKWANFAILAAGLGFLFVKNAGPYFATRSTEIRKGIEDAQKMRAEAQANAAEMEARLANIGREVEAMRKSAKDEAALEGARIRQETERELAKIQSHSDQEIAAALKTAQMELKNYSAQLAIDLAQKKVREQMTPAVQDTLVEGFVADLTEKLERGATP